MRYLSILLSFLCLAAPQLRAQEGTPRVDVKVKIEPATAKPGDTVTLTIDGEVHPGYHIYGSLEEVGVVPNFKVDKATLAVLEPKGDFDVPAGMLHDTSGVTSFWLVGPVTLTQKFVVRETAPNGKIVVSGGLNYMACTEEFCDPEYTENIAVDLTITGGSAVPTKTAPKKQDTPALNQFKPRLEHQGNKQILRVKLVPPTANPGDEVRVEVHVTMDSGWHNYGSKQDPEGGEAARMKVLNKGLDAKPPVVPPGKLKKVEFVGDYYILKGEWVMHQTVTVPKDATDSTIPIEVFVGYTACDEGQCLDPEDATLLVPLTVGKGGPVVGGSGGSGNTNGGPGQTSPPGKTEGPTDGTGKAVDEGAKSVKPVLEAGTVPVVKPMRGYTEAEVMFEGGTSADDLDLWLYLLGAVGAGLFALIMPCTYPMIPLTISFFTKQAEAKGGRPVFLALAYGGGIVLSYVVLGGLLGSLMQDIATNPWVNLIIGAAFVFFACSLFGMVELKPPQFLMNSATKAQVAAAKSETGLGVVIPVFMMGLLLCVTSFACTAPFLGSMIAAGADGGLGRLLTGMGVFGLTMALPFVILSLVPGRLPQGGAWMNSAKILFGFVELAAALKFFSNAEFAWDFLILPRQMFLAIWAALFLVAGIYMLGLIKLKGETGEIGSGRMLTGSVVLILALCFGIGANGYKFDNQVMSAFEPPYPEESAHKVVEDDFDRALEVASTAEKLLLINFTGKT